MKIRIDYVDPGDGAAKSKVVHFDDAVSIPAVVRAEDYAFTIARDGYYNVTPMQDEPVPERDWRRMLATLNNRARFVTERWVPLYMLYDAGELWGWRGPRIHAALDYLIGVAVIEKRTEPISGDPDDAYWRVKLSDR